MTLTGWSDEDRYDYRGSVINRVTTQYGIACGSISIVPGGSTNHGSFGFRNSHENIKPITIDQVRGVLVTALATSQTDHGRVLASGVASIVEKLSANCFQPVSYDLCIEAAADPTLNLVMTNGMQTIHFDTKPVEDFAQAVKLDLDVPYILGQGFVNVLAGEADRGHSPTGLSTLVDGKWVRHTGISSYTLGKDDKPNVDILEVDEIITLVSEERRELTGKILIAIIKQLNLLGGFTNIYQVSMSHGEYRGNKATVVVRLVNAELRKNYSLEFQA
ncbi:hypothetical protein D3C71_1467960 [compost metagenome]